MPMIQPQNLKEWTIEDLERRLSMIDSSRVCRELVSACTSSFHQDTQVRIHLPTEPIMQYRFPYELIQGTASLQLGSHDKLNIEIPCFVACGSWHKLRNINGAKINLIEYFDQLLPRGSGIGLFTCMNGIQNNLDDFEDMCNSITSKLTQEKPLFIGLYNPTNGKGYGFPQDFLRLSNEWVSNVPSIISLRQMFATFGTLLSQIRPRLLWTHIAHSEGGLLANRCLTNPHWGLTRHQKQHVRRHLITLLYGAVASVPDKEVLSATNTYSTKDIAFRYAKPYLDKFPRPDTTYGDSQIFEFAEGIHRLTPNNSGSVDQIAADLKRGRDAVYDQLYIKDYPHKSTKNDHTVTIVKCISKNLPLIEGDHGFINETYQNALKENLNALRKRWGILW